MIVLGVDAALNKSGLAICQDDIVTWTRVVRPPAKLSSPGKLHYLYDAVKAAINGPEFPWRISMHDSHLVIIERPGSWTRGSTRSKQSTVEALAQSRAAVHLAAEQWGIRSEEIDVNEARRLILGDVSGKTVVRPLLIKRGVDAELIKDPDAADAAVIALAGWSLWKAGEYD